MRHTQYAVMEADSVGRVAPYKTLSVAELRGFLDQLRDDDRIFPNRMFNLAIFRPHADPENWSPEERLPGYFIGFIDPMTPALDLYENKDGHEIEPE